MALIKELHKLISALWRKKELPKEWKTSIIVPIYKKGDKSDCNNYRGNSLLPTCYKELSNILLTRVSVSVYVDKIIGDHQCPFRRSRSTLDQIFTLRRILEKKWEYNGTVYQLFIDFKKAYDSIRRKKLYSILIRFEIPKKLVQLVKMCLNDRTRRVRIGNNMSDSFKICNGLKQGDALSPLLFNFAFEYSILKIKEDKEGLSLNCLYQLFVYADDVDLIGDDMDALQSSTDVYR